ncbi:MAG: two-component regulator propeller domain-containing protein, partial [Thalassotalea sp.]|nr:two-component regulator propeller domain-containing protein [Thalassotalea sp.]
MQLSFISSAFLSRNSLILLPLLFLLFIGFSFSSSATPATFDERLKFKHLTAGDGLSQNNVFDIVQDNDGFIWIATENGLNKYDGKNIIHYKKNISDPNSIVNNFIRKLFIDDSGEIWIGTEGGLSKYNKKLDNFENFYSIESESNSLYDNYIWDIYQDNNGTIWVSTEKGIQKFNSEDNTFIRKRIRGFEEQLKEIKTIFQDHLGYYWLGTFDNGVYIVDDEFTYAFKLNEKNKWDLTLKIDSLYDVKEIDNRYWLASENGIYVINKEYKLKKHYLDRENFSEKSTTKIRSLILYNKTQVFAASENGLHIINITDDQIYSVKASKENNSLSLNYLMGVMKDKENNIWVSTYGKGVNTFNPISTKINHISNSYGLNMVDSIYESPNGSIWLILNQTLLRNISKSEVIKDFQLAVDDIFQIIPKNDSEILLFSTQAELSKFNIETKITTQIDEWNDNIKFNTDTFIQYKNNNLWLIELNGNLANFNLIDKKINRYQLPENEKITHLKYDNFTNNIWSISEQGKLYKFNLNKLNFEFVLDFDSHEFTLSNSISVGIGENDVWIASEQGVLILEKKNLKSNVINQNSNLLNKDIYSILIDKNNNGWAVTNNKLIYIEKNTEKVRIFSQDYILSTNEFISGSHLKSSDEYIYIGSMNGYYKFSPYELLETKQIINTPVLSNLLIANKKINIEETKRTKNYTLPAQLNSLSSIKLQYIHSPFSIEFSSPNAKLPNQLGYRYKLIGVDENWLETDSNNLRATYTNLNAGTYTFEVQAFDIYDPKIFKSKSIDIKILPPWWLSNSAVLIYTLIVFLVMAYLLQQFRHKRLYHLQIKASEERLKLSLWGSGDEMWDWNIKRGKIYRSNIWGILEFPQDGKRNLGNDGDNETNINQADIARITHALQEHFEDKTEHFEATYRVKDKDDKWIWVLDRG